MIDFGQDANPDRFFELQNRVNAFGYPNRWRNNINVERHQQIFNAARVLVCDRPGDAINEVLGYNDD